MDGKEPLTGQWNYDHDNRSALKDQKMLKKADQAKRCKRDRGNA